MLLIELYQEEKSSTFTHDGQEYSLNKLLVLTDRFSTRPFKLDSIKWILKGIELDDERVQAADVTTPLLVTWWNKTLVVLDGTHRVKKAVEMGLTELQGKFVYKDVLEKCKI